MTLINKSTPVYQGHFFILHKISSGFITNL
jgi:hypothetical protein